MEISKKDDLKSFLDIYAEYQQRFTSLNKNTMKKNVKMVADLLRHGLGQNSLSLITGSLICDLFQTATSEDPPGYLLIKKTSLQPLIQGKSFAHADAPLNASNWRRVT